MGENANYRTNKVPQDLSEVSQAWVEEALIGEDIGDASLPRFRLEPLDANNSTTARLIFEQPPHHQTLPRSLVLKICSDQRGFLGASEPYYSTREFIGLEDSPIVTCYAAVGSGAGTSQSEGHGYAIFLQD